MWFVLCLRRIPNELRPLVSSGVFVGKQSYHSWTFAGSASTETKTRNRNCSAEAPGVCVKQDYFMSLAKNASAKSDHYKYKLGCVIVKGSRVLGIGWNAMKTHPKSPHEFKMVHAEFMAVMSAEDSVEGATAYIFREHKNGTLAMAKPCESCWGFLVDSGVSNIVYSFEGTFRSERVQNDNRR